LRIRLRARCRFGDLPRLKAGSFASPVPAQTCAMLPAEKNRENSGSGEKKPAPKPKASRGEKNNFGSPTKKPGKNFCKRKKIGVLGRGPHKAKGGGPETGIVLIVKLQTTKKKKKTRLKSGGGGGTEIAGIGSGTSAFIRYQHSENKKNRGGISDAVTAKKYAKFVDKSGQGSGR